MRQTARRFAEERIAPAHPRLLPRRPLSLRADSRDGRAGLSRRQPGRLRLRRHEQRGVRARSCRSWSASIPASAASSRVQGALVMYPILTLRLRGAEAELAAAPAERPGRRLLRADRAGFRLEPRRHAHHRPPRRRRLDAQRREDLDHQRQRQPTWRVVWARAEEGIRGLPGGARHARLSHLRNSRQMVDARLGHLQPVVGRLPRRRMPPPARRQGAEGGRFPASRRRATASAGA